jgi:hypothetical protein
VPNSTKDAMMCAVMISDARRNLEEYTSRRGLDLTSLDPSGAIDVMIQWYETVRAVDAAPSNEDGDGLLLQSGTYAFEQPETFQYTIIRQFISRDDDADYIWQLSLTLHYEPSPESRDLEGDKAVWCFTKAEIPTWRATVQESAATEYVVGRRPARATVTFEQVC